MMTDDEKAELEKELNGGGGPSAPAPGPIDHKAEPPPPPTPSPTTPPRRDSPPQHLVVHGDADAHAASPSPSANARQERERERAKQREAAKKRAKVTQEQRERLREQDEERRRVMKERVAMLTTKMVERLRPFVEAKHPGEKDDPETMAFENKMKREAEDLKLESFGVEVVFFFSCGIHWFIFFASWQLLHTIGNVYMMKASSFMKSRKFLGMYVHLVDWVVVLLLTCSF